MLNRRPLAARLHSHSLSPSKNPRATEGGAKRFTDRRARRAAHSGILSLTRHHDDLEWAPFPRLSARGYGLRRRQVDFVSCGIHAHGPCAGWRFYGLYNLELSRPRFAGHGERAIATTGEDLASIDFDGVNVVADRQVRQHLAVLCAHHDQLTGIAAANKQAMIGRVDR